MSRYQTPRFISWLPEPIKAPLRTLHREHVLRKALGALRRSVLPTVEPWVFSDLVYGWGNEGMSAQEEYLTAVVANAMTTKGPILECGSGLSTVILRLIAERRHLDVWSLEEDSEYASQVAARMARLHAASRIVHSPLTGYGEYDWYALPPDLPTGFTLVVCDGPSQRCRGGRYGLVPLMLDRLAPGCTILLDDAMRVTEQMILMRWTKHLGSEPTIVGRERPFAVLPVPRAQFVQRETGRS